jgi:Tol biopolymer transport system component
MITKSGAKLLDFGLAKPALVRGREATREKSLTEKGTVVGTIQYMAPEQLEGREVDARTDLFALGATLYEMVAAKPAFDGDSYMSLVAAIRTARPQSLSAIRPQTPPVLEHVIARCLRRDPDERWQSAGDVAGELKWIAESDSHDAPAAGARHKSRRELPWIAALLLALAAVAWLVTRPRLRPDVIEAGIVMAENLGLSFNGPPALSPNGKVLAYLGRDLNGQQRIWLREMDRGNTLTLAGAERASFATWSPDGRFLAFATADGQLKKISSGGGTPEILAQRISVGGGVTWGRDDVILFLGADAGSPIYRIGASGGGERSAVLAPASIGATTLLLPSFLPNGKRFLFLALGGTAEKRGESGIWVATLDGSEKPRLLTRGSSNATYVDPGFLLFARDGQLRAQRFDENNLRLTGPAMVIAPVRSFGSIAFFTASSSGLLIYQPPESFHLSELMLKNHRGEVLRTLGRSATYRNPRVAPDGRKAAVEIVDERGNGDIWIFSPDGPSRFTFEARHEGTPVWSPRSDEIAYSMDIPPDGCAVLRKRIGQSPHMLVTLQQGCIDPSDWSPDGRYVAMTRYGVKPDYDATVWSIDERKFIDVAATPAKEGAPVFSPDGRWIAYESDESGRNEIYVQPFPMTGAKEQVSSAGGSAPHWSRTGRLSWVDLNNRLTVVSTTTSPSFRATEPQELFPVDHIQFWPQYDLLPDGTFLTNVLLRGQAKPMTVVVNWTRRLDGSG